MILINEKNFDNFNFIFKKHELYHDNICDNGKGHISGG